MPLTIRRVRAKIEDERGSVTVEAAIATSAIIVLFALLVAGLFTLAAYLSAIDIAGAAAREYAITGNHMEPARGSVVMMEESGKGTATAEIPSPFGVMRAQAVYPVERL